MFFISVFGSCASIFEAHRGLFSQFEWEVFYDRIRPTKITKTWQINQELKIIGSSCSKSLKRCHKKHLKISVSDVKACYKSMSRNHCCHLSRKFEKCCFKYPSQIDVVKIKTNSLKKLLKINHWPSLEMEKPEITTVDRSRSHGNEKSNFS